MKYICRQVTYFIFGFILTQICDGFRHIAPIKVMIQGELVGRARSQYQGLYGGRWRWFWLWRGVRGEKVARNEEQMERTGFFIYARNSVKQRFKLSVNITANEHLQRHDDNLIEIS